jgi:dephospho-CoA kinase
MGKSACAQLLGARGVAVVDTDDLAREVVEPGRPALEQVRQAFGPEVLAADGSLRRSELARRVFADPAALKQLEAILHPPIRALWQAQAAVWRSQLRPHCVIIIPLLFETGAEAELDATLCVACSAATQRRRLLARGWTVQQIEQRVRAQWPIEKKMRRADYVVWTEGGLDLLAAQLARIGLGEGADLPVGTAFDGQPVSPHPGPLPKGEGAARAGSRASAHRRIRRPTDEDSPSPRGRGPG